MPNTSEIMRLTLIQPCVGKSNGQKDYIKTWQMEPLPPAIIASLTPKDVEIKFYDDRIEDIPYEEKTDLVGISVETYTAKRSYQIASEYRKRGIPVLMGGFHPTLIPNEVINYADHVVIGEIECIWKDIITDFKNKRAKKVYKVNKRPNLEKIFPDRTIYKNKKYLNFGLVETGRGCIFKCDFCSITNFYKHTYNYRPIKDVIKEIKSLGNKYYFFVDDNICSDVKRAKELFKALIPLKIKWVSQGSIHMANDKELLELMKKSGCECILIGFESLSSKTLRSMNKWVNLSTNRDLAIKKIHGAGIKIYATFIFGYDTDSINSFRETYNFAVKHKFFLAAFNHLIPFPGTPLYKRLKSEKRLLDEKWWLNNSYTFGDVPFKPKNFTSKQLSLLCYKYRKKFYTASSLFYRMFNFKTNFSSLNSYYVYLFVNFLSKIDINKRQGLCLGINGGN